MSDLNLTAYETMIKRSNLKPEDGLPRGEHRREDEMTNHLAVKGRVVLNVEQVMKFELSLFNYDIANVAFHLFQKKEPFFSQSALSECYSKGYPTRLKTFSFMFR